MSPKQATSKLKVGKEKIINRLASKGENGQKPDVPSLEKALDVLELLSTSPQGLTMNEIANELNRTMGELYRIVISLSNRGYISQDPDTNRYDLTLQLFELSHRHNPTDRLVKYALPILEKLAYRTEQSCHLAVLHQTSILVLASVPSPRKAGYSVQAGAVFPIINTSSGIVILSFMPKDTQSRFLSSFNHAEQEVLKKRIHQITHLGFEQREGTLVYGITNLSAPVFDRNGIVAAVTMAYIGQVNQRTGPSEALDEVRAGARELTTLLGGSPLDI